MEFSAMRPVYVALIDCPSYPADLVKHAGTLFVFSDRRYTIVEASKLARIVRYIDVNGFTDGGGYTIRAQSVHPVRVDAAWARANRIINRRYDLISANCQHTANYVYSGEAKSPQLAAAGVGVVTGVAASALGLAAAPAVGVGMFAAWLLS
jgi:hypothetical protein